MKPTILLLAALLFLLPRTGSAQTADADLTGTWKLNVDLGGEGGTATFTLKQEGKDLTGTYQGALGKADVTGTLEDGKAEFSFTVEGVKIIYKGTPDGKEMKGTCDYGGYASGTFSGKKEEEEKQ